MAEPLTRLASCLPARRQMREALAGSAGECPFHQRRSPARTRDARQNRRQLSATRKRGILQTCVKSLRPGSQVVRQRSAKPRFTGSNPVLASEDRLYSTLPRSCSRVALLLCLRCRRLAGYTEVQRPLWVDSRTAARMRMLRTPSAREGDPVSPRETAVRKDWIAWIWPRIHPIANFGPGNDDSR